MISIVGSGLAFDFAYFGFILIWIRNQKKFGVGFSIAGMSFLRGAATTVIEHFLSKKLRNSDKMQSLYVTFWHPGASILPVPCLLTVRWGDHRLTEEIIPFPAHASWQGCSLESCRG